MKRKPIRMIAFLSLIITTLIASLSLAIAWFSNAVVLNQNKDDLLNGETEGAFFEYGDGTEETPFGIKTERQFYNLAWLQYTGYFYDYQNRTDSKKHGQYYFELAGDITISKYTLPPVGTEKYPFTSVFDGKGHTITNLLVSNSFDSYGQFHPYAVNASNYVAPHILGAFGVVGKYDGDSSLYNNYTASISNVFFNNASITSVVPDCLVGIAAGYVNGPMDKVGIDNSSIHVPNSTTQLDSQFDNTSDYAVVGYCEDAYKQKIYKSTTDIYNPVISHSSFVVQETGEENGWGGSIDMVSLHSRLQTLGKSVSNSSYRYARTDTVDVDGTKTTGTSQTQNARIFHPTSTTNTNYNNVKAGSLVLNLTEGNYGSVSFGNVFNYISGGQRVTTNTYTLEETTTNGYKISDGNGNYMRAIYNSNGATIENTTDATKATVWRFSGDLPTSTTPTSGYIYTSIKTESGGSYTDYYLYSAGSTSNNTASTLSLRSREDYDTYRSTFYMQYYNNNYYAYIRSSSSGWSTRYYFNFLRRNGTTWQVYSAQVGSQSAEVNTITNYQNYKLEFTSGKVNRLNCTTTESLDYSGTQVSYLPLNVDATSLQATNKNTGYIVGGCSDTTTTGTYPYKAGDIRVSYYDKNTTSNVNNSRKAVYSSTDIYTNDETFASNGQHARLTSTGELTDALAAKYPKYKSAYKKFRDIFDESDYVYGLHFMDAQINKDNLVTASWAYMNKDVIKEGETDTNIHTNFKMPASSIDFLLQEKGSINFFAGTYFKGNNTFFSLHQIVRDSSSNVTAINEINKIYGKSDGKGGIDETYGYVYSLNGSDTTFTDYFMYTVDADGNKTTQKLDYTGSPTDNGYELIYDTDRIKNIRNNNFVSFSTSANYLYYFEIPVNEGEYALGSVKDGTGAYLLYLDIAANSARINRTTTSEYYKITNNIYYYPKGVGITKALSEDFNAAISACFVIKTGFAGQELTVKDTSDDSTSSITFTGYNSEKCYPSYGDESLKIYDQNSVERVASPLDTTIYEKKTVTYYDYYPNDKIYNKIVYTQINDDGEVSKSVKKYKVTINEETGETTETEDSSLLIYSDKDGNAVTSTQSGVNNYILDSGYAYKCDDDFLGDIVVTSGTDVVLSYYASYLAAYDESGNETTSIETTVNVKIGEATYISVSDADDGYYFDIEGYEITIETTSIYHAVVKIVNPEGYSYTYTINNSAISAGSEIDLNQP